MVEVLLQTLSLFKVTSDKNHVLLPTELVENLEKSTLQKTKP